jgi:hypothetical protein
MPEIVDKKRAAVHVAEAAALADDPAFADEADVRLWIARIRDFSELLKKLGLKSYVAHLGVALLAKATNPRVDAFSLKKKDVAMGSYSVRGTVGVLVDASKSFRFDLAARGPEPLNNQPFFRVDRLTPNIDVSPAARPALERHLELLHEIQQLSAVQALRGLAAFIFVRRTYLPAYASVSGDSPVRSIDDLALRIHAFVSESSERGLRAQACVGGAMDVVFGPERVRLGKIHEPDRGAPGDVAVRDIADPETYARAYEVRDKVVTLTHLLIYVQKLADAGVARGAVVAIAAGQKPLDGQRAREEAHSAGISLEVFESWSSLLRSASFWQEQPDHVFIALAIKQIRERLIEMEASSETVARWDAHSLSDG